MNPFQTAKKTQNLLEIKENNISTSNDLFNILSKPKSTQVYHLNLTEFLHCSCK